MTNPRNPLRLNVGFLLNQPVGYSHKFPFDYAKLQVEDDLELRDFIGAVDIGRTPQGLLVQADFKARLDVECVRCLTSFEQAIHFSFTELFAFNKKSVTESGLILPDDAHIDLQPLVRDYALLEVPMSPICKPACQGLCPVCGEDRNRVDCGHHGEIGDTPLAGLKDLLKDK